MIVGKLVDGVETNSCQIRLSLSTKYMPSRSVKVEWYIVRADFKVNKWVYALNNASDHPGRGGASIGYKNKRT